MTTYPDGAKVYTPFPEFEETVPAGGGATTQRSAYYLAGRLIATRVGQRRPNRRLRILRALVRYLTQAPRVESGRG